jgi:hypothetical protein
MVRGNSAVRDVTDVFLRSPTTRPEQRTESELAEVRHSVHRRFEAQIDYAALTPQSRTAPPPTPPSTGGTTHHTVFNLSGTNPRVNIGSEDNSQNVVNITPTQLFAELRSAFEAQVVDAEERQKLLTRLAELETAQQTPSFGERYINFMAAAASHATVIGPYLPALAQLIQPR